MAINTGAIANLLRPGLNAVFGDYPMYPSQWSEIFDTYQSDMATEYDVEMKMLGLAQIRAEGSATAMDTMGQRVVTQYLHKYVALGFVITRQAMKDNLYKAQFPKSAKSLKESLAQTKEILGASVLNNGYSSSYLLGDGQPLYSTAHPIDGGVYANTPSVQVDLNEASLEAGVIAVQQFKSQSGLIVNTKPDMLIVPPQLQFQAERMLFSAYRPGTANNDISAINRGKYFPKGFTVNQYLTNPAAWFIKTNAPEGFKHFVREAIETDTYADFTTDNIQCKALERYSFGVSNPRCTYGSSGA